jgi:hypothetical protein
MSGLEASTVLIDQTNERSKQLLRRGILSENRIPLGSEETELQPFVTVLVTILRRMYGNTISAEIHVKATTARVEPQCDRPEFPPQL